MIKKTIRLPGRPLGDDAAEDRFWLCVYELGKDVCGEFAQFAKVPGLSREAALDHVYDVLCDWIVRATFTNDVLWHQLSDVSRKTTTLHHSLKRLNQSLVETALDLENGKYDDKYFLDLSALEDLSASKIEMMCQELSALNKAAERLCALPASIVRSPLKMRRRPHDVEGYPGLDALVFALEESARLAGGRFTVHRKLGAKGSLILMLDRLRNCLQTKPDLRRLAELIPVPGKHPVALYERALKEARKRAIWR
jgi:hypothetical protein